MFYLVVTLHVLVCLMIIAVVLLQAGKGADIGSAFGGFGQPGGIRLHGHADLAGQGHRRRGHRLHADIVLAGLPSAGSAGPGVSPGRGVERARAGRAIGACSRGRAPVPGAAPSPAPAPAPAGQK